VLVLLELLAQLTPVSKNLKKRHYQWLTTRNLCGSKKYFKKNISVEKRPKTGYHGKKQSELLPLLGIIPKPYLFRS